MDGSRAMDLVRDVERTAAAVRCDGAGAFGGGWEVPYYCIESGMGDDFGGGEGWWHVGFNNKSDCVAGQFDRIKSLDLCFKVGFVRIGD